MHELILKIGGPTIMIFIGGLISAIGAVWAAYDKSVSGDKLAKKNEEIVKLYQQLNESILGGDSFAYVTSTQNLDMVLVHRGTNPIYDLAVEMVDLDALDAIAKAPPGHYPPDFGRQTVPIGNLSPKIARQLKTTAQLPPNITSKRYNIFFYARNGTWGEQFKAIQVNGTWNVALRVWKNRPDNKQIALYEQIPPDFPRNKDGSVDW